MYKFKDILGIEHNVALPAESVHRFEAEQKEYTAEPDRPRSG